MAKRINIKGAAYLLTTNTKNRFPYFNEDIFCNILVDVIANCQKIKPFNLISFKINPEHAHLILQPTGKYNISQIMHSIKKTASLNINQIIYSPFPDSPYEKFKWTPRLLFYRQCFKRKFNYKPAHPFPAFDWQDDFDDQLVRTPEELSGFIHYLERQAAKHKLSENKFLYSAGSIPSDIVFIGEKEK